MIWLTGPDKSLTFVNKTWLDFRPDDGAGTTGRGAAGIHPDDLEHSFAKFNASFDARETFHVEHRLCRADGEYRWVLCSGVPRFSSEGIFAGYIGSATDITDVRGAEQELALNKALKKLPRNLLRTLS